MGEETLPNLFKICEPTYAANPGAPQVEHRIALAALPLPHPQGGLLRVLLLMAGLQRYQYRKGCLGKCSSQYVKYKTTALLCSFNTCFMPD